MPITVNQNMVKFIADDDTIDGTITVSANVDPGNLIQEVGELLGINFDPNTTPIPDYDIATLRDVIIELWDDLIAREIVYVADEENADSTINRVSNLPAGVGGVTYSTLDFPLFPDDIDVFLPNLDILPNMPAALPTAAWGTALHEFGHRPRAAASRPLQRLRRRRYHLRKQPPVRRGHGSLFDHVVFRAGRRRFGSGSPVVWAADAHADDLRPWRSSSSTASTPPRGTTTPLTALMATPIGRFSTSRLRVSARSCPS